MGGQAQPMDLLPTWPRVPTDQECEAILGAAWTPREKAIIGLMLMGGLRRGEVLGLNVEDVSADYAQILVRGKGSKERMVPLCPALRGLLIAHLEGRGACPGPLFVGRTGRRMTVTSFIRLFRRVLKRVSLEDEHITRTSSDTPLGQAWYGRAWMSRPSQS